MSTIAFHNESKREDRNVSPGSINQQGLWFLDQLKPAGTAYNVFATLYMAGPLDVDALERGLQAILQRHEALHTALSMVEGQLVQVVASAPTISLPVRDLRHFPEAEREAEVQQLTTG